MKKLIFLLLLALGTGAARAQVKFETKSTDAVREMAIKQGKLVFIDLYASWCPPCRMMEKQVFSRKDVGEFMDQRFVAAKYDTDKTTGRELLKKYGSGSIPLYLVFDTRGELLGRITAPPMPRLLWIISARSSPGRSLRQNPDKKKREGFEPSRFRFMSGFSKPASRFMHTNQVHFIPFNIVAVDKIDRIMRQNLLVFHLGLRFRERRCKHIPIDASHGLQKIFRFFDRSGIIL